MLSKQSYSMNTFLYESNEACLTQHTLLFKFPFVNKLPINQVPAKTVQNLSKIPHVIEVLFTALIDVVKNFDMSH